MANARPLAYRVMRDSQLSGDHKDRLAKRVRAHGSGSAVTQGNLGAEVGLLFVGLLLLAGGGFLVSITRRAELSYREPTAIAGGLALCAWSIWRLVKRAQSRLGTFTLSTDAYYIVADAGVLRVWSLADAGAYEVVNHYKNGGYQGTSLRIAFGAFDPLELSDRVAQPSTDAHACIAQSPAFRDLDVRIAKARAATAAGHWGVLDGADLLP